MKFGITLTLTACVLSIVAVGICAVAWQQWTAAKRNTEDLTIRNAGLVIGQIDSYLDQFLDPAAQYVGRMAETAVPNGWHLEDTRIPNDILAASVAAAPEIITAGMLFNTGKDAQYVSKDGDSAHYLNDRSGDAYYESFRELRAMAKNPSWVEPAYDQVLETSSVRVWHAIRAGGQYFGAWYAGVSLAAVSEAVTEVGERFDGTAFVIHGDKHVLAHPNLMSQHPEPKDGEPTVSVGRVGDLILDGIWKDADAVRESDDASGNLQTIYSTLDGQDYVGFFRRIYRYGSAPWTIGVWFEAADVGLYRERLITAAWAGVGIILLALIMAVLASRAIARPIRRTATAVSAVGDGDISAAGFMPPSRITELNDLANSFNAMRSAVKMFETYVPRSLVRRLMSRDETLVASSERQLTVMFTDIVGFTTMAEGRSATEVADMVNEHFQILGACVEEHGGTIDKYIGDALMAFWGAPEEMDETSTAACYCAMAMVDALERDNHRRRGEGLPEVRVRIGIHTGPALVGNIGAAGRVNYTIIGDTVNTCQQIENLGREIDNSKTATILITDTVAKHIPSSMPYMHVGSFTVKGRDENVEAYRLMT